MNQNLLQILKYSYIEHNETYSLPAPLKDSLQIVSNFFANNKNNKLCLAFPTKEYASQWLSTIITIEQIQYDYINNLSDIFEAHKKYKKGDKLLLNDDAVVEWAGSDSDYFYFKTKPEKNASGVTVKVKIGHVKKLKPTPPNKSSLSPYHRVAKAFYKDKLYPLDDVLNINTEGNFEFIKNKVCLVNKYKSFDDSLGNILINNAKLSEYFPVVKINEDGTVDMKSPLLLANNLSTLALNVTLSSNTFSKIIIDGIAAIQERATAFSDIDIKNIPTILITDLAEIDSFELISNYGFEFFNFTKENLQLDNSAPLSPFHLFNKKLGNYISFKLTKEICHDSQIEMIAQKIHSIKNDESNNDLTTLKISLIQLFNRISRIAHVPSADEISNFNSKIISIETLFLRNRMWLGDSYKPIEESISLLKSVLEKFITTISEKCVRLKELMNENQYDFIICRMEEEKKALNDFISNFANTDKPLVISVADLNDNLLTIKPLKAILTGWAKSYNINRILYSFLFSEVSVLFYDFENKYYDSLQSKNRKNSENIRPTISNKGIRTSEESVKQKGFDDLYSNDEIADTNTENSFNIFEIELKLDNIQYSKYKAKGSIIDSIKAKRVDFEDSFFIYSSDSHKFLLINELVESSRGEIANLHKKKIEALKSRDVIALINTDRDVLVDLVEKNTNPKDLEAVKQWTDLWKNLLKEYFVSSGNDFKKLVNDLRLYDCKKHEVTIRAWLQDENRIGPNENADLISIAMLTNSNILNDNINTTREAIRKMTGWRMKASDFITDKIKAQIHELADSSIINTIIQVEGLGSVIVLKVIEVSNVWENIDVKYVNRLLQKENI